MDEAEWGLYGTVEVYGTGRSVWRSVNSEGKDVFQMTHGDVPANGSGYYRLETLLALKDVTVDDLEPTEHLRSLPDGQRQQVKGNFIR